MSTISKDSSESEISDWLTNVVGLTNDEIQKFESFEFLDGESLFSYDSKNAQEFKQELKIPIGIARKILMLRDRDDTIESVLHQKAASWKTHEVSQFIKNSFSKQSQEIDEICSAVQKNYIDGFVFLTYENPKDLQSDLQLEEKFGVIYRRILTKRDIQLCEQTMVDVSKTGIDDGNKVDTEQNFEVKGNTSENNDRSHEILQQDMGLHYNVKDKIKVQDCSYEAWISFISTKLHLNGSRMKVETDSNKFCKLNLIHSEWKNRNLLEKKLIFFILSENTDFDSEQAKKTLWDLIRKAINLWNEHFEDQCGCKFENSQKEDTLIFNKQAYSLSKSPVKMRFPMEKTLSEFGDTDNVFLLISKGLLYENVHDYITFLERPIGKKKPFMQYRFTFETDHKYWLFDPEDFSHGFKLEYIPRNCCGNVMSDSNSKSHIECLNKIESTDDCINTNIERKQQCDTTEDDSCNDNQGNKNTEINRDSAPRRLTTQLHRTFKADGTDIAYREGCRLLSLENDGSASFHCFEFKFVPDALILKGCKLTTQFINKEILRFACGCLNARKNGTIIFGIADSQGTGCKYVQGEVVGILVDTIPGDFRADLTLSLRNAIEHCFENSRFRTASRCISSPHFIQVISEQPSCQKFVIEIDIEPSSILCKQDLFKINRSIIMTGKDIERTFTVFLREDTGTKKKTKHEERLFLSDFPDIIQKRIDDEHQMSLLHLAQPTESPMDKLRKILCKGSNKFDKSIWPILVLSKPTCDQKRNDQWLRSLKFIKVFDFHAVFDFDDDSNHDGLCSTYRNAESSILHDEEIFQEFSGKKLDLATKLGMPHDMKTVWIFCNGRSDIMPPKPCETKLKWTKVYSAGIRDAVIFYSQNEIIPKGRALVIVLLFSNNFDGLTETFREITVRFGVEHIVVIATDDNILHRFMLECKDVEENIHNCGISGKGVTWEHINSTFFEITGYEDPGNVFLTTSSGAIVPADEKFIVTLYEFQIMSARLCENKKFKSSIDREEFESEIELNFYRGQKVDWFNFFFETHVLKRYCFDRLKNTIFNILINNSPVNERDKKIVCTVIVAHEPGAGGTTLSRHILWEFHKQYRCAIISKITERTAKNVLSLWQHKETKDAKPLLLLVDELLQSDVTFESLVRQLHNEYRANPTLDGLVCCFLVCQRENEIKDEVTNENQIINRSGNIVEQLKQKLTDKEVYWMDRKYERLEKKGAEYKPDYLLSFMILREGFNQEYIKNTIKHFLTLIDMNSNEFELLEYASLVSTYAPTARRAPHVYIPLECFDELIGSRVMKTVHWEKSMSNILKIFLIVEQKETASGLQIRMAHPTLAQAVLQQILDNKNESLSCLTLRFLNFSILQSPSYGREMLLDLTKEMLLRRLKEEYNDDKTTSFSLLIEDICQQDHWVNALDVLERGFDKIKDSYMAQTLARLCSKNTDFEQAIHWAKQAVEISLDNKTNNGVCHQIYAVVLEEKFIHQEKKVTSVTPANAVQYIELILDALDNFLEASRLRIGTADHILYPIMGVIQSILNCLKFIRNKVFYSTKIDIKKYLVDENYSPEEIDIWKRFRPKFSKFQMEGEKAFALMEQSLCFYTTYYAHDSMSSFPKEKREHQLYKNGQYRYADYFHDFGSFFGENGGEMPKLAVPEVLNNWHRRRLIRLGGNSYMNICSFLSQIRKRAIARCVQIKHHLSKITDRNSKDLSNLVSVNIVLGLLGSKKRKSTNTILEYCKHIIKIKKGYEDVSYFFICLLLWPSTDMLVEYDDNLFYDSLRYLIKNKEIKQGRPRESKYSFLKEEKNVTQPTSQFFLTNGKGFDSFCYRVDIFFREEAEAQFDTEMWENFGYRHDLKLHTGFLKFDEGKPCIRLKNDKSTLHPHIEIRKFRTGKKEDFLFEEEVHFYLGFSIAGPIAYNVKPARHMDFHLKQFMRSPIVDNVEKYIEDESVDTLQRKLELIEELKVKKTGTALRLSEQNVSSCFKYK